MRMKTIKQKILLLKEKKLTPYKLKMHTRFKERDLSSPGAKRCATILVRSCPCFQEGSAPSLCLVKKSHVLLKHIVPCSL